MHTFLPFFSHKLKYGSFTYLRTLPNVDDLVRSSSSPSPSSPRRSYSIGDYALAVFHTSDIVEICTVKILKVDRYSKPLSDSYCTKYTVHFEGKDEQYDRVLGEIQLVDVNNLTAAENTTL